MAAAQAEDLIVVDGVGTAYKRGSHLDGGKPLTPALQIGQTLVLERHDDGKRIAIHGPFNGIPQSQPDEDSILAETNAVDTLTSRGGNAPAPLTGAWLVDLSRNGNACVRPGTPIVLWRPPHQLAGIVTIEASDGSWSASTTAEWPAGTDTFALPADFPIFSNETYVATIGDVSRTFSVVDVPDSLSNNRARAAWMIYYKCTSQADWLIKHLDANP